MPHPTPELLIVMPAYNEQATVESVVREWIAELGLHVRNFTLLAIDDGSTDSTLRILKGLKDELGDCLEILSHSNRGHGQSCIAGYRVAVERQIPFVFQIDSDGQSAPKYFQRFWGERQELDVIYGKRIRSDGGRRIIASFVLRVMLRILSKVDCVDANVPYRLMNTAACANGISRVPENLFLANVALAVILRKDLKLKHGAIPIGFPPRRGGEPSVPLTKFAGKAIELFMQMKRAGI